MSGSAIRVPVQMLGQSGCRLGFPDTTVYLDPYLSNSVQQLDAPDLERQVPIPVLPEQVTDADWVLITHEHIDHCDPHTIPKLAAASPTARIIAPAPVLDILLGWGIAAERLQLAEERWLELSTEVRVRAVPAAHPDILRDEAGKLHYVGYLLEFRGKKIYLAGDTSARQEIIDVLRSEGPVHTAFLPVNEHNFFRGRRGIIGNMSVREAFQFANEIEARQVVAVHWDMFTINSVDPDEIRLLHRHLKPGFGLLINPEVINLSDVRLSIVVRTLNEAKHLEDLLKAISSQLTEGLGHEVVIVDSGSTDATLEIAEHHGCLVKHIAREDFSFGRSLNIGCNAASGDILVITSGHCVPVDELWLQRLCQPLLEGEADYTYGRQVGGGNTRYSEHRIFSKYYPDSPESMQSVYYCNNANAALSQSVWEKYRFDEELTGLEDMALAQRLVQDGGRVAYVNGASVYHFHDEAWSQVRRRFEREAIALQQIMPQVHVSPFDAARYIVSSVWRDWIAAIREGVWFSHCVEIIQYRWNQYLGTFIGNHQHRRLSHAEKERYFFPD